MKLINTIKTVTLVTLATLSFTACGSEGSFEENESTVDITIPCVTNPTVDDIDNYITLQSGDTITKEGEVTIVTYHDSDGVKKVCKDENSTGNAFILKGNL